MTPRDRHLSQTEGAYQGERVDARNHMREARESSVVMDNQQKAAEEYVPKTAARRNITSRRSRGRQEGFGKDPHSLIAKQTRGRSRDREYTQESIGARQQVGGPALPGPVMLARCKTRMRGEMDHRTQARVGQLMASPPTVRTNVDVPEARTQVLRPVFLKRDIPTAETAPEVRAAMLDLLGIREQYREDGEEALHDGDEFREEAAQRYYDEYNERMHDEYEGYVNGIGTKADNEEVLEPEKSETPEACLHYVGVEELPLPFVHAHVREHVSKETATPTLPQAPRIDHRSPPGITLPLCPTNQHPFQVWLGFEQEDECLTIWDTFPLATIYGLAFAWIVRTFFGDFVPEHMTIVRYAGRRYRDDVILGRTGVAYEIPLNEADFLEIQFTIPDQRGHDTRSFEPRFRDVGPAGRTVDEPPGGTSDKSFDKLRQSFKLPKFTGNAKDWKLWNQGLMRYLSIWNLDHVTDPDFADSLPLTSDQRRDNKLVYYILEDAVQGSPLARSYVQKAPRNNGFEAYYTLLDGFVFAGTTTASLLLNELTNFRFKKDETPTELCLRLEELFQDLKSLPGEAAMVFNDTQCIGYLLAALRHEREWATVHSSITSSQIKGNITFAEACDELRVRCEASRAHDTMDRAVGVKKVQTLVAQTSSSSPGTSIPTQDQIFAFISTMAMKHNPDTAVVADDKRTRKGKDRPLYPCLAKACSEQTPFPLCGTCYHSLIAAKVTALELKDNYGNATYNVGTKLVVYPDRVPSDRMPSNIKRVRGGIAGN